MPNDHGERYRLSAFQVAAAYVGTVVGAGYASGQEVLQFFTSFGGREGLVGVGIAGVLLAFFGAAIPLLAHRLDAASHGPLLRAIGGPVLAHALDALVLLFLMGSLSVMIAGFGAALQQQLDWPLLAGRMVLAVMALGTVLLGVRGVVTALSCLTPVMMVAMAGIAVATLAEAPVQVRPAPPAVTALPWWALSAVVYVSYNLILAMAVLAPLGRRAQPRTLVLGGAGGGLMLGLGVLLVHLALLALPPSSLQLEVPMAAAAQRLSPLLGGVYLILLLAAIYTTAVGSLWGLTARWGGGEEAGWEAHAVPVVATLAALLGSQVGFSRLVGRLYALVGLGGLLLMILLVVGVAVHRRGGAKK